MDRLGPFTSLFYLELYLLSLMQCPVSFTFNAREVNKDFVAVLLNDKTEALALIEPLDPSDLAHADLLLCATNGTVCRLHYLPPALGQPTLLIHGKNELAATLSTLEHLVRKTHLPTSSAGSISHVVAQPAAVWLLVEFHTTELTI